MCMFDNLDAAARLWQSCVCVCERIARDVTMFACACVCVTSAKM